MVRSGTQSVINWSTFCHLMVKSISMMVNFIGCNQQPLGELKAVQATRIPKKLVKECRNLVYTVL